MRVKNFQVFATRALLSPFCASLLLGRKHYLRGLYALCGFIYFNSHDLLRNRHTQQRNASAL